MATENVETDKEKADREYAEAVTRIAMRRQAIESRVLRRELLMRLIESDAVVVQAMAPDVFAKRLRETVDAIEAEFKDTV